MSGMTIPLFSKRKFDFDSGSGTVVVVKALDTSRYKEGTLLVRVHEEAVTGSSTLKVSAKTTAPSVEDPSQDFIGSEQGAGTLTSATNAGDLLQDGLTADFGGMLQIQIIGTVSGGTCNATISADLSLKE